MASKRTRKANLHDLPSTPKTIYSDQSYDQLRNLVSSVLNCTASQLEAKIALLYAYLQPTNIPTPKIKDEDASKRGEHAATSLLGLSAACARLFQLRAFTPTIRATLKDSWSPRVWPWIGHLHKMVVEDKAKPWEERRLGLTAIIHAIECFGFDPPLREVVARTPGLHYLLARIWYLEATDPQLNPALIRLATNMKGVVGNIFSTSKTICEYVLEITNPPQLTWVIDLEAAAEGKLHRVAFAALTHFRRDILTPLKTREIWEDVQAMTVLSAYLPLQWSLLSQHSVRTSALALSAMVSGPAPSPRAAKDPNTCDAITYLCFYLTTCLEAPGSNVWVLRAVEAGLLPSLLRSNGWSKQIDVKHQINIVEILPKYLAYASVMRAVTESLKKVDEEKLEAMLTDGSKFEEVWKTFRLRVTQREEIFRALQTVERCHNKQCNKDLDPKRTKRCGACLNVSYCSAECSKISWEPTHKKECKEWTRLAKEGEPFDVTDEDRGFLIKVMRDDIRSLAPDITNDWREKHIGPRDVPLVYIDRTPHPWMYSMGTVAACKPAQSIDWWAQTTQRSGDFRGKHAVAMETFPRGGDETITLSCILTLDEDTVGDTFKKLDVYMQSEHEWTMDDVLFDDLVRTDQVAIVPKKRR